MQLVRTITASEAPGLAAAGRAPLTQLI